MRGPSNQPINDAVHDEEFVELMFYQKFLQLYTAWQRHTRKDKHPKRYHLIQETLNASSIPESFPEALDTCFGGELLRYANLTPALELDAERNELRENPLLKLGRSQEIPQTERSWLLTKL